MMAYLMASVTTGLLGTLYGLAAEGASLWSTLGWYLAGCWGGFALMLVLVALAGYAKNQPAEDVGAAA